MKPHPPQLFASLRVSVHPFAQQRTPAPGQPVFAQVSFGGVQVPLTHESPRGQTCPHAPQFDGSVFVFFWQGPPPSMTTQVSLAGSQVVPSGHVSPFAQEVLFGRPSSPCREEREQPAIAARRRRKTAPVKSTAHGRDEASERGEDMKRQSPLAGTTVAGDKPRMAAVVSAR
jgi:hypothetical protein